MRRFFLFLISIWAQTLLIPAAAQDELTAINAVVDACKGLQTAIASGSAENLRSSNNALKKCDPKPLTSLRYVEGEQVSLDGHFVFDKVFVDSLIAGRDVYKFAQRYADDRTKRGTSSIGSVYTKTCSAAKTSTIKYSLPSRGHQELAIITEPGGLVNVKIHDKTNNIWHRATDALDTGMPSRTFSFDLPEGKISVLEIEIENLSKKDISFVIISN